MTTIGFFIMIISITSVLTLVSFALFKVLSLPPNETESLHGQPDIDTGDLKDPD